MTIPIDNFIEQAKFYFDSTQVPNLIESAYFLSNQPKELHNTLDTDLPVKTGYYGVEEYLLGFYGAY